MLFQIILGIAIIVCFGLILIGSIIDLVREIIQDIRNGVYKDLFK